MGSIIKLKRTFSYQGWAKDLTTWIESLKGHGYGHGEIEGHRGHTIDNTLLYKERNQPFSLSAPEKRRSACSIHGTPGSAFFKPLSWEKLREGSLVVFVVGCACCCCSRSGHGLWRICEIAYR